MNRTEYKNNFYKEHYERINLAVPKGMKDIITDARIRQGNVYQRIHSRPCQKRPVRNVRHDAGCRKEQGNDFRNHWKHARRI